MLAGTRMALLTGQRLSVLTARSTTARTVSTSLLSTSRSQGWRATGRQMALVRGPAVAPQLADRRDFTTTCQLFAGSASIQSAELDQQNSQLLHVSMRGGQQLRYPVAWLRAHCQCPQCYFRASGARMLLMENFPLEDSIASCEATPDGSKLKILWTSGHISEFETKWLLERAFNEEAKEARRQHYHLPKKMWGYDHTLKRFSFPSLMGDDSALLGWLQELEQVGATLITEVPPELESGNNLSNRVGFYRKTYFGALSNVHLTQDANNLAYTDLGLNLHSDLCYYEHLPGIILLHMIRQHAGKGGDSTVSDSFLAANILRKEHPDLFESLATSTVYYYNEGIDRNSETGVPNEYNRITRTNVINVNKDGEVDEVRINNQTLDSFVDMPVEDFHKFITALKRFNSIIEENCVQHRLQGGEMIVLDNTRCLHGRKQVLGKGERHLVTSYLSWDEARCMRRRLSLKLHN